jgi:hypothetical protein
MLPGNGFHISVDSSASVPADYVSQLLMASDSYPRLANTGYHSLSPLSNVSNVVDRRIFVGLLGIREDIDYSMYGV